MHSHYRQNYVPGRPLPRWLWLERRRDVARWDDLRRAVWAARRTSTRPA